MRDDRINMLNDTLRICEKGQYMYQNKLVKLKLSPEEMRAARVFLPDEIGALAHFKDFRHVHVLGRCGYGCENADAFALARKRYRDFSYMFTEKDSKEILVLNLANPVNPGGGVRRGARAQEEDLCRSSSLLLSLEGPDAEAYYRYNRSLHTKMGSDAIIITPKVEIIRDEQGELLEETVIVAVMTCAAPCLTDGMEGLSQKEYEDMLYRRIMGMLRCAAYLGYKNLVLGAFGCGAFRNDGRLVSDLFYKALKEFDFDGMKESDMFNRIDFAVLSRSVDQYNFKEFYRNFGEGNFYRDEDKAELHQVLKQRKEREVYRDKIRGAMIGGAAGDALGYAVEFFPEKMIRERYGPQGITRYERDPKTGKALISDDTQMALFTANSILVGKTRLAMRGIGGEPHMYIQMSYLDWLTTQEKSYESGKNTERLKDGQGISWLLDVPELYNRRAPGNTCLSALREARLRKASLWENVEEYLDQPRQNSQRCGGIMRVAPLGIVYSARFCSMDHLENEAALLSAVTHGHPLGCLPSAVLVHILNRIVYSSGQYGSLREIIIEARDSVCAHFRDRDYIGELRACIDKALALAENSDSDRENIRRLGGGWVAEETLAIALYCALRYEHDFSGGLIASVNHGGDSDSTGAVTGNILGAINGYDAIEDKWKTDLELSDVILEMADDLCYGCQMEEYSDYYDPDWARKYIDMRWKKLAPVCVFFWKDHEENGWLSNWYPSPFVLDDFRYDHVEQYLMAQKARLFHDAENYTAILKTDSPKVCKELGRKVANYDGVVWEQRRGEVLKTALRAKFTQNEDLKQALLATGNSILAEASPRDGIYGIRLTAEDAASLAPEKWPGQNLLGKALMEIREELRSQR